MVTAHQKALAFIKASTADALADTVLKNAKTAEQFAGLDRPLVVKSNGSRAATGRAAYPSPASTLR